MNGLSRAMNYILLRKINRHAHTFGIAIVLKRTGVELEEEPLASLLC